MSVHAAKQMKRKLEEDVEEVKQEIKVAKVELASASDPDMKTYLREHLSTLDARLGKKDDVLDTFNLAVINQKIPLTGNSVTTSLLKWKIIERDKTSFAHACWRVTALKWTAVWSFTNAWFLVKKSQ